MMMNVIIKLLLIEVYCNLLRLTFDALALAFNLINHILYVTQYLIS